MNLKMIFGQVLMELIGRKHLLNLISQKELVILVWYLKIKYGLWVEKMAVIIKMMSGRWIDRKLVLNRNSNFIKIKVHETD